LYNEVMNTLVEEYKIFLAEHADKQRAEKEKAYLYSELEHYGVSVWEIRKFVKKHKKELTALDKKEVLKLVKFFWDKPSHEERSLALSILNLHKDTLTLEDMPLIEQLMRESKGWAFLDSLIIPIMPVMIEKDPQKAYGYLKKWIKDDDFWVRRSALLAQILPFRANNGGDKNLFFELARSQFDESWIDEKYEDSQDRKRARFFIRKAIGWTIREISQKDPNTAFDFLKKHKGEMSGLSFREGSRKLPEDLQKKLQ
jgi:3-methyladenine DNA glycosylase AlkD